MQLPHDCAMEGTKGERLCNKSFFGTFTIQMQMEEVAIVQEFISLHSGIPARSWLHKVSTGGMGRPASLKALQGQRCHAKIADGCVMGELLRVEQAELFSSFIFFLRVFFSPPPHKPLPPSPYPFTFFYLPLLLLPFPSISSTRHLLYFPFLSHFSVFFRSDLPPLFFSCH